MQEFGGKVCIAVKGFEFLELTDLPRLPIPTVEETLQQYLFLLKPLVSAASYANTEAYCRAFLKEGGGSKILQEDLKALSSESPTSWLHGFWNNSYLADRQPNVINVNPFFLLADPSTPTSQVDRATTIISSSLKYWVTLKENKIPFDFERKTPLCMSQYGKLFGTTRIPGINKDTLKFHPNSSSVCVLRHGRIYILEGLIDESGRVSSEHQIQSALREVIQLADEEDSPLTESNVGITLFTTFPRSRWASVRATLLESNAALLSKIDSALFMVCLDTAKPKHPDETSRLLLHSNGVNRWFDKFQFIVFENGEAGINMEHSPYDGHSIIGFTNHLLQDMNKTKPFAVQEQLKSQAIKLTVAEWKINYYIQKAKISANKHFQKLLSRTESSVVHWNNFGKKWIVTNKVSPDAFVQMAFQLAYYKMQVHLNPDEHPMPGSTYESALVKRFYHGRTECVKSVSPHSDEFCRTFINDKATDKQKAAKLRAAIQQHVKTMRLAKAGKGTNRHLYGLQLLANMRSQKFVNFEVPALFKDPNYATFGESVLSTSNCGGMALTLFGFGPVQQNGLGLGYIIKDNQLIINVTSFIGQAREYSKMLKAALNDMYAVFECEKASPKAKL